MAFQGENHIRRKIAIGNKTVEKVSSFNYFSFNASNCLKEDIRFKLGKFQRKCATTRSLRRKPDKVHKLVTLPSLTYARENRTINRIDKRQVESAEMRFLLPVPGYSLLDQRIKSIQFN
jgi:hypothetical protein